MTDRPHAGPHAVVPIHTNGEHAPEVSIEMVYGAVCEVRASQGVIAAKIGSLEDSVRKLHNSDLKQHQAIKTAAWPSALPMWILVALVMLLAISMIVMVSHRW